MCIVWVGLKFDVVWCWRMWSLKSLVCVDLISCFMFGVRRWFFCVWIVCWVVFRVLLYCWFECIVGVRRYWYVFWWLVVFVIDMRGISCWLFCLKVLYLVFLCRGKCMYCVVIWGSWFCLVWVDLILMVVCVFFVFWCEMILLFWILWWV